MELRATKGGYLGQSKIPKHNREFNPQVSKHILAKHIFFSMRFWRLTVCARIMVVVYDPFLFGMGHLGCTPPKTNVGTQNDGLEDVTPSKNNNFGIYVKFQGMYFAVDLTRTVRRKVVGKYFQAGRVAVWTAWRWIAGFLACKPRRFQQESSNHQIIQFKGNQTVQIYGDFDGFCLVIGHCLGW